ncbi:MAG TPA: hypothetical protein VFR09_04470, partial [Alphaproteobacteria bacterium]|nr:hypothetical protein [Alphaproteobacteria bacterium]
MTYSVPFDLRRFKPKDWITNKEPCWDVGAALDATRHYKLVTATQAARLRPRDKVELRAGQVLDYKAPSKKAAKKY